MTSHLGQVIPAIKGSWPPQNPEGKDVNGGAKRGHCVGREACPLSHGRAPRAGPTRVSSGHCCRRVGGVREPTWTCVWARSAHMAGNEHPAKLAACPCCHEWHLEAQQVFQYFDPKYGIRKTCRIIGGRGNVLTQAGVVAVTWRQILFKWQREFPDREGLDGILRRTTDRRGYA